MFTFSVQSTCSFVKQKDFRFSHKGSSYGDSLLLSARQPHTSFTNFSFEAFGEERLVLDEDKTVSLSACKLKSLCDLGLCHTSEVSSVKNIVSD